MLNQLSIKAFRAFLQILQENYAICCKTKHLSPRWCSESVWANTPSMLCVTNCAYFLFTMLHFMRLRTFSLYMVRKDDYICIVKPSDVVFIYLITAMKWKILHHGKWQYLPFHWLEVTNLLYLLLILIWVVILTGHWQWPIK